MEVGAHQGAIRFAERVLELLDDGRYTATYKYAVLLGLMELCLEQTQASGAPPAMFTTRQLAEKVVELYWPHTMPFVNAAGAVALRQNRGGQAEILTVISRFREQHAPDPSASRWEARLNAADPYERLVREVEWKLIEMPLPRLQTIAGAQASVLYAIAWDAHVDVRTVRRYQRGDSAAFDNRILLQPLVGEYLLQLNGLLRPLVQRQWATMVARLNALEESQLDSYLFGASRIATARVRAGLWDLQDRRCFYCDRRVSEPARGHVDHFVPWSRYPDDSLDNFVFADERCNGDKSASLAAAVHLERWSRRLHEDSTQFAALQDLASAAQWERHPERSLNVVRGIYLRLPDDARLWLHAREYTLPDRGAIGRALMSDRPE